MQDKQLIEEQIEYYRRRAPEYDKTAQPPGDPLAAHGRQIEAALDAFRPTGRVLEIASGTGTWTQRLLRHASHVTALDSSREMHELSRAKLGDDRRVRYIEADVFTWEPDRRYDVVFFANWLSHVPPGSFERFWHTVRRAVRPRGSVFFVDEIKDAWRNEESLREEFVGGESVPIVRRPLQDGTTYKVVKVFWGPDQLRQKLRALGWEIEVGTAGPFFWAKGRRAE